MCLSIQLPFPGYRLFRPGRVVVFLFSNAGVVLARVILIATIGTRVYVSVVELSSNSCAVILLSVGQVCMMWKRQADALELVLNGRHRKVRTTLPCHMRRAHIICGVFISYAACSYHIRRAHIIYGVLILCATCQPVYVDLSKIGSAASFDVVPTTPVTQIQIVGPLT